MSETTSPVVDRFLAAICAGDDSLADGLYTEDVVVDAVVPGWRFAVRGADAVVAEYSRWFASPGSIEELSRHPTGDGEVVEYTLSWMEDGVPHGARHVHVIAVDREVDRIVADHVWCGGRWPADLLAQMGAAAEAVDVES